MTMKGPFKFAVVGCGRISKNHFISLSKLKDDVSLVAVCDTDNATLNRATKELGVPGFSTIEELLEKSPAEVVVLCTPSGLHAEQAILALNAKRHVVSEKPMATHWSDGVAMVRAAQENNRKLFVVKQNRLNPTLQLLKQAVTLGRFGRIYMATINVFWTRPQDYYDQAPWRGTWKFDGGAYMNQASHYVDLLDWILGPVEVVQAFTGTLARKIEAEDTGVVAFRLKNGGMGSMNVTMLTYPKNLEGSMTIIGEKGTVRIGGLAVNEIQHWEFSENHPMDQKIKEASYETTSVYGIGHPLYYENVISALKGEAPALTDGHEGLKSLELLIAIYRSARNQQPVRLPLEVNS